MIDQELAKICRALDADVLPIVVVGRWEEMLTIRGMLRTQLEATGHKVEIYDLNEMESFAELQDTKIFQLIWGLEALKPHEELSFRIRTILESQKYAGLKFIIFCEEQSYSGHFHDRKAPFYHFCTHHKLSV